MGLKFRVQRSSTFVGGHECNEVVGTLHPHTLEKVPFHMSSPCAVVACEPLRIDSRDNACQTPPLTLAVERGRTWTLAHHKALLTVVFDHECCFILKHANREMEHAWKLFGERIRGLHPSFFSSKKLNRKPVRLGILDMLEAHRDNENNALRSTGRVGSVIDKECIHLCEEVCARFDAAQTERDEACVEKNHARQEK